MASAITTRGLIDKCKQFVVADKSKTNLDSLIKEALIQAGRDIHGFSLRPLKWDVVPYSGLKTYYPADISDITQASPGVFTADSRDSDATGHGFPSSPEIIVVIDTIEGMDELNTRLFRLQYVSSTTFTLKSLDGLSNIATTNYDAYSSGGIVYHIGTILNTSTILTDVNSEWGFKRVVDVNFDGFPTEPISETDIKGNSYWASVGSACRPKRWRHWNNITAPNTFGHYLFWYPAANQEYNIFFDYQKEVPDLSTWDGDTYPLDPIDIHDAYWHRALDILAGNSERMKRGGSDGIDVVTKVEVMYAQKWATAWAQDKDRILILSKGRTGGDVIA